MRADTRKSLRAVAIMANALHKAGMTLSQAFKKAWRRIKRSMTIRATGVMYGNRQERLRFLRNFNLNDMYVTLERESSNKYDPKAIRIVVHIKAINRKTIVGYVPRGLSATLAAVIDHGINLQSYLTGIIGGYSYKESLGVLINIAI